MAKTNRPPDSVTVTTISIEDSILPVALRWPPPHAALASDPQGFSYFWQLAEYAFHLPSPYTFPAFDQDVDTADRSVLERFILVCEELAGYTLMSASDSIEFTTTNGETTFAANFSSTEALRGFTVLFRQLYAPGDEASFIKVVKILSKLNGASSGDAAEERRRTIAEWRRANGVLQQRLLSAIVGRMVADTLAGGNSAMSIPYEDVNPTEVISRWEYGDVIHWGKKRDAFTASRNQSGPLPDLDRFNFQQSMVNLSHLYLGFSVIAARALGSRSGAKRS